MHSRTSFIESVYYSAARRKEADDDDRWVENGGEQLPICQKCQTPVAVKKHLLSAGARFSTQDHMTPRTMIESQYCNSGILANYAINRKSNTTGFDDAGDRDDYRSSTMLSPFAQTQQTMSMSASHHQVYRTPIHQEHQLSRKVSFSTHQAAPKMSDRAKATGTSEYAWTRHDQDVMNQYAIGQLYEEETAPAPLLTDADYKPVAKNSAKDQAETKIENVPNVTFTELESAPAKSYDKMLVESMYVGIPNDLYPAYRSKAGNAVEVRNEDQSFHSIVDKATCGANQKCESVVPAKREVKNDPPNRSRFQPQIKLREPVPVNCYQYYTKRSTIGNAFTPVSNPRPSEYHAEDLNDLASCVDPL